MTDMLKNKQQTMLCQEEHISISIAESYIVYWYNCS